MLSVDWTDFIAAREKQCSCSTVHHGDWSLSLHERFHHCYLVHEDVSNYWMTAGMLKDLTCRRWKHKDTKHEKKNFASKNPHQSPNRETRFSTNLEKCLELPSLRDSNRKQCEAPFNQSKQLHIAKKLANLSWAGDLHRQCIKKLKSNYAFPFEFKIINTCICLTHFVKKTHCVIPYKNKKAWKQKTNNNRLT